MPAELIPSLALLVHKEAHSSSPALVLSLHSLIDSPDGRVLDAGRVLSSDEAREIGNTLIEPSVAATSLRISFLPPQLLRQTPGSLTWFRPATRTAMYWRTKDGAVSVQAVLPGLVFHVRARALYVAAFTDEGRPTEHTALYHAPLGNVFDTQLVCTGNASLPNGMNPEDIRGWSDVLLATNFSHINHQKTLRAGASTEALIGFWKRRARCKTAPSSKVLAPLASHLSKWVSDLEALER